MANLSRKITFLTLSAVMLLIGCGVLSCDGGGTARPLFICATHDADGDGQWTDEELVRGIFALTLSGDDVQVKRISEPSFWHDNVAVSPPGNRIAYTSLRQDINGDGIVNPLFDNAGGVGVHAANPDGSKEIGLLYVDDSQEAPSALTWSRDGKQLAINLGSAGWSIINADGSNLREMSWVDFTASEAYNDFNRAFSPDGSQRVWPLVEGGWTVTPADATMADARNVPPMTDWPSLALAWSPDGTRILLASQPETNMSSPFPPAQTLHAIKADGSGLTQLSAQGEASASAGWSPDGKQVAFLSWWDDTDSDGVADAKRDSPALYVVNADGSQKRRLLSEAYRLQPDCLAW